MTARRTGEPQDAAPSTEPDGREETTETVEEGVQTTPVPDEAAVDQPADPDSDQPEPVPGSEPGSGPDSGPDSPPDPEQLERALAERTADLQRIQAEYVNYKRRVDRDRELVRENATYSALAPIVDVLDTIDRAREHGDLDEGFQAVADQLERVVAKAGLLKYGDVGDPFDPRLHEALSHIGEDPEVEVTTCKVIAKAGYRIGDRVVRAAQVLVVDPVSA